MRSAQSSRSLFILLGIASVCILILLHRTILHGEVYSLSGILFSFYPWAYDGVVPPADPSNFDLAVLDHPLLLTHWQRLQTGEFPDWDPLTIGGAPAFFQQLNTGQSVSPLNLPLYLLPFDIGLTVSVWLRPFCAALFMGLWLRESGINAAGTIAGGLAFGFTGIFTASVGSPVPAIGLFLPLSMLLVERVVSFSNFRNVAALGIVLAAQATATYPPSSVILTIATVAYGCWWIRSTPTRAVTRMVAAGAWALLIGAIVVVPMAAVLSSSPMLTRSMSEVRPLAADLVTLAMPGFWGMSHLQNWWHPLGGHSREFVHYFGIVSIILAGAGAGAGIIRRDRRCLFLITFSAFAFAYLYDVPPVGWLRDLPVLRQMNPFRWNLILALSVAALSGHAVGWMTERFDSHEQAVRKWATVGATSVALSLIVIAAIVTVSYMPAIQVRHLQAYEKWQLARLVLLTASTVLLIVISTRVGASRRRLSIVGCAAILLVAADLVHAAWGVNPTLPRQQVYATTAGLEFLRDASRGGRIVPVDDAKAFPEGHVFSVYDIATVSGVDFRGDRKLERFLMEAGANPPRAGAFRSFVFSQGLLDLKLLGLLNVTHLVSPPVDTAPRSGGVASVGELTTGRTVVQTFTCQWNGLRRVDVLTATFGRANTGALRFSVRELPTRRELAVRVVKGSDVPNLGWVTLEHAPEGSSKGRQYEIEIQAVEGIAGGSATVMTTQSDDFARGNLTIDRGSKSADLWFRAFSAAADRWDDASLVFAKDLNVYRNRRALPRAWFAREIEVQPGSRQLDRLKQPAFDPSRTVLLNAAPVGLLSPTDSSRVTSIQVDGPDTRIISVSAPRGGILVLSERYDDGWHATIDGAPARLLPADDILMAMAVPAGAREVRLNYRMPYLRSSAAVSGLSLMFAAAIVLRRKRRHL